MTTLEQLKKKLESTKELKSIVKVMKTLAATNIRQCEKALIAAKEYSHVVELGLSAVLKEEKIAIETPTKKVSSGIILFGSDLGLCGQFNERLAQFSLPKIQELKQNSENFKLLIFGEHIEKYLHEEKYSDKMIYSPSFEGLSFVLQELLAKVQSWISNENIYQIFLIYLQPTSQTSFQPILNKLLPLDADFFLKLTKSKWPTNEIPFFTIEKKKLLDNLLQEYIFVSLHEAIVESLTSEYGSRLLAMTEAEKNIDNFLDDLKHDYNQKWQEMITEEILDIETGFESLKKSSAQRSK